MRYESIERFYITTEEFKMLDKAKHLLQRCQFAAECASSHDLLFSTVINIECFLNDYVAIEDKEEDKDIDWDNPCADCCGEDCEHCER